MYHHHDVSWYEMNMGGGQSCATFKLPLADDCFVERGSLLGLYPGGEITVRRLLGTGESADCLSSELVVRVPFALAMNVATVQQLRILARMHGVGGSHRTQSAVKLALESHVCVSECPFSRYVCSRPQCSTVNPFRRSGFHFLPRVATMCTSLFATCHRLVHITWRRNSVICLFLLIMYLRNQLSYSMIPHRYLCHPQHRQFDFLLSRCLSVLK